ncbi:MAG: peptidylprolyl isomerase [Desulfuromonadales bacterium]
MRTFLFIVFFAMLFPPDLLRAAAEEAKVVARIGDRVYTIEDFQRWMELNPEDRQEAVAADDKKKAGMLNQIITNMVIADVARKQEFDRLPDINEKMKYVINGFLSLEYIERVVAAEVSLTQEEIKVYYEENIDKFSTPEQVRARYISIKIDAEMDETAKQGARKKAEEILTRVRNGGDFAALAKEYSDDQASRNRGGYLGWFGRGSMLPEFEAAAFALQSGETSEVVESSRGFYLIKVEERKEGEVKPLEDVRQMIEGPLLVEKKREAINNFVQQAMQDAGAEVYVEALQRQASDAVKQ